MAPIMRILKSNLHSNIPTINVRVIPEEDLLASQTSLAYIPSCMDIIPLINFTSWIVRMLDTHTTPYTLDGFPQEHYLEKDWRSF